MIDGLTDGRMLLTLAQASTVDALTEADMTSLLLAGGGLGWEEEFTIECVAQLAEEGKFSAVSLSALATQARHHPPSHPPSPLVPNT